MPTNLLFAALARIAGLSSALTLIVGDLGSRHDGGGQQEMDSSAPPSVDNLSSPRNEQEDGQQRNSSTH